MPVSSSKVSVASSKVKKFLKKPSCLLLTPRYSLFLKKIIVANWKMSPTTLAEAEGILEFVDDYLSSINDPPAGGEFSLVFCPPFVFIEEVAKIIGTSHLEHQAFLGAQDISTDDKAALTGEVSGPMLSRLGVRYVIIGHSERRWKIGESDEVVNRKLKSALRNEFIPIVCIGEKIRDDNFSAGGGPASGWKKFLKEQVDKTCEGLTPEEVSRCIIAYEPVWAISSNPGAHPDTPASAIESISEIKTILAEGWKLGAGDLPQVLYGGSVNSKNAGDFLKEKDINGVLVGGASVNKEEFVRILEKVSQI